MATPPAGIIFDGREPYPPRVDRVREGFRLHRAAGEFLPLRVGDRIVTDEYGRPTVIPK